jgi:hypothetical protein
MQVEATADQAENTRNANGRASKIFGAQTPGEGCFAVAGQALSWSRSHDLTPVSQQQFGLIGFLQLFSVGTKVSIQNNVTHQNFS